MAILGILKHSKIPLRIFTLIGVIASVVSILIAFFFFYNFIFEFFEAGI